MTDTKTLQDRFAALKLSISDEIRERADAVMKAENYDRPEYRNWMPERVAEDRAKRRAYEVQVSLNGEERIRGKVASFLEVLRQEKRDRIYPLRAGGTIEGKRSSEFYDAKAREVLGLIRGDIEAFEVEVKNSPEFEYVSWLHHYVSLVGEFKQSLEHISRYQTLRAAWLEELDLAPLEELIKKVEAYAETLKKHFYLLPLEKPKDFREWDAQLSAYEDAQLKKDGGGGLIPNLRQ